MSETQTSSKRKRIYDAQMVTKIQKSVKDLVNEYAASNDAYEADVVRWALGEFFEKRGIKI